MRFMQVIVAPQDGRPASGGTISHTAQTLNPGYREPLQAATA